MDVIRSIDNWIDEGLKLVQKSFASAFSLGMGWCGRLHCFCSVTEGIPSNDPSNFRFFFVRSTIVFLETELSHFWLLFVCCKGVTMQEVFGLLFNQLARWQKHPRFVFVGRRPSYLFINYV